MRAFLDKELAELKEDTARLAATAAESSSLLKGVVKGGKLLKTMEELYAEAKTIANRIEERCVRLLIHQQPVAGDLRYVKAVLRVIVDLCRICEQSMHVSELNTDFKWYDKPVTMAEKAASQVRLATECYLKNNLSEAKSIVKKDDEIDDLFDEIKQDLIGLLKASNDNDDWVLDCLLVSKYLERISDHAANIAKQTANL